MKSEGRATDRFPPLFPLPESTNISENASMAPGPYF